MRRQVSLLGLLVLLALPARAGAAPATIRLLSVPIQNKITDVAPKGASKGDVVHQRTRLFNASPQFGKPRGVYVGYDVSVIRFTSATTAVVDVVVHLPGGTLHVHGKIFSDRTVSTYPVVSGTGAFAGAHGTGTEIDDPNAARALNVYHLVYGTVA
jgi:dirigent-like protein